MPHFVFTFSGSPAGCVERICLYTPWSQPQRDQTGQVRTPEQMAWAYLLQFAAQRDQAGNPIMVLPQGAQVGCTRITDSGDKPNVYCVQTALPQVTRAQHNAPFSTPVGNGQMLTMPPEAQRGRTAPVGSLEEIHDCALTNSADALFGESDGLGGTFSDIDRQTGQEVLRQATAPLPRRIAGQ